MEEEVILDIKIDTEKTLERLAAVNQQLEVLKGTTANAKKAIKEFGDSNGQLAEKIAQNEKETSLLKGEQQSLTAVLQSQLKVNASLGDSYNEINARVKQLQKEYKSLTAEQRESAEGKALLAQLNAQKDKLKEIDASMGDYFRNVGNYAGSLSPAFGKLNGVIGKLGTDLGSLMKGGFSELGTAIGKTRLKVIEFSKTLLATPIGWIAAAIALLIASLGKIKEAFDRSDDASTNLAVSLKGFQPIITLLRKLLDGVVNSLAILVGWLVKLNTSILCLIPSYRKAVKAAEELELQADRLEDKQREYTVNSAKRNAEVAELRAKSLDKEKYTAAEREKMLSDAIKLEEANLAERKAIAQEELDILRRKYKEEVNTSDDAKNKIAEAEAALYNAEREFNDGTRRLRSQLLAAQRENAAEEQKLIDERIAKEKDAAAEAERIAAERAEKERQRIEAERQRQLELIQLKSELSKEIEDTILANMEDGTDKAIAAENVRWEREKEAIIEKYGKREELQSQLEELLRQKENEHTAALNEIYNADEEAREQLHRERMAAIENEWQAINDSRNEENWQYEQQRKAERHAEEMEALRQQLEEKGELTDEEQTAINDLIKAKQDDFNAATAEEEKKHQAELQKQAANSAKARLNTFSSVMDSVGSLADAFAEDDEERAKASKVLAVGKALVNSGIAISEGMAASAGVPFPGNIAAIATTIAAVATNIATAVSTIKSAKFAEGGVVKGQSYIGDKVPARVNSGEMILTRKQQTQLFDIANGRTAAGGIDYTALAAAMSAQPAPVMVYSEFEAFGAKQAKIKEITRL